MGVYTRFKKSPDGIRQLVELIESTPLSRRQKMIDVGMQEDPGYTQKALSYVLVFEDVLKLPDMELAEVLASIPGRFAGFAIWSQAEDVKNHFLSKAPLKAVGEIREVFEIKNVTPGQIGGAQMKLIEATRKLEKRGLVKTKRIET
ncbi:MAG: hypothetical protein HYX41_06300 [Bdellovibrio sp.]|nr:hypothetical protein [Bdellovibrio sp.]